MNRLFTTLASLLALSAGAGEIWSFDNARLSNGNPLIIPAPQQYEAKDGFFSLGKSLTIAVPAEESLIFRQLQAALARFEVTAVPAAQPEQATCLFKVEQENVPDNPEGYTLSIGKQGILVRSRSHTGLFYGAQTLRGLLEHAEKPQLDCCEINDYPDLENRLYTIRLHNVKDEDLPKLKGLLDAMGRLKLNGLSISLAEAFPYEKLEFAKRKIAFSAEKLAEVRDYCRERHISIMPSLQFLSHNSWLMSHADWDKMTEGTPGSIWNCQACIQNEEARAITLQALREQIAFFKPKIASVGLDEIYLCPFRVCPRCKDVPAMELLTDYMDFIHKGLADTGVKIQFCYDCFTNSPKWPYGDEMRKLLNPETDVIGFWSYREIIDESRLKQLQQFHPAGTAIAGMPGNVRNMINVMNRNHGNGVRMTHWYFSSGGSFVNLKWETPESAGGFVIGADYMWHNRPQHHGFLTYDATHEMMRFVAPEQAAHFARGTEISAPQAISLQPYINAELCESGEFPVLDDELAQKARALLLESRERFQLAIGKDGRYYGVRLSGYLKEKGGREAVHIELGNYRTMRLSLLMTSTRPTKITDYTSTNYGKYRFSPKQAAAIRFEYEDGTTQEVPLSYRYDFNDWNSAFGGYNMKLALRGLDCNGEFFSFGICDIINPSPEKLVKGVVFRTLGWDGISPVLLALSAWDSPLENRHRNMMKPFDPNRIQQKPYTVKKAFESRIVYDFEDGVVAPVYLTQYGDFQGEIKMEVVEDPKRGKVLKVSVPPGVANKTNPYVRVSIDMPYRIQPGSKGLVMDCRLSHLEGFSHSMEYLNTRDPGPIKEGHAQYWAKKAFVDTKWKTVNVSFADIPTECDLEDKTLAKTRRISFFFRQLDKPVEIYLDNLGEVMTDWQFAPKWTPMSERDRHY